MIDIRGDTSPDNGYLHRLLTSSLGAFAKSVHILVYSVGADSHRLFGGNADPLPHIEPGDAARLREAGGLLAVDWSSEGRPFDAQVFAKLARWCAANSFPTDKLALFSQNPFGSHQLYTRWVQRTGTDTGFRFGFAHSWLDHTIVAASRVASTHLAAVLDWRTTKRFLSMNNAPRLHRLILLRALQSWATDDALMSLSPLKNAAVDPATGVNRGLRVDDLDSLLAPFRADTAFIADVGDLLDGLSIDAVVSCCNLPSVNRPTMRRFDEQNYRETMLSIVGESEMSDGRVVRFTEKSIKPSLFGHPFLIAGNPSTLAFLKRLGLVTFPELFDESYDVERNPVTRLHKLLSEVHRLARLSADDVTQQRVAVRDKIVHNCDYAYRGLLPRLREWQVRHVADIYDGAPGLTNLRQFKLLEHT